MNKTLQFSKKDYLKSTNQYLQSWLQIDNTLYSLCQKNYDHVTVKLKKRCDVLKGFIAKVVFEAYRYLKRF